MFSKNLRCIVTIVGVCLSLFCHAFSFLGKELGNGYSNWGYDEPNNRLNSQDCVLLHKSENWAWRDFTCSAIQEYSYICEYGETMRFFGG